MILVSVHFHIIFLTELTLISGNKRFVISKYGGQSRSIIFLFQVNAFYNTNLPDSITFIYTIVQQSVISIVRPISELGEASEKRRVGRSSERVRCPQAC